MAEATKKHLKAMFRIMCYVEKTRDIMMKFETDGKEEHEIVGYSDSDWAKDRETRKSISGFAIFFKGNLVSWKSKSQNTVTLSSTEAEYVALTLCVNEMIFIKNTCEGMKIEIKKPMIVYMDNTGAIDLAHNWSYGNRSKHIDTRYHYIRRLIEKKENELRFVRSEDNKADIFTKNLSEKAFKKHTLSMVYKKDTNK